MSVALCTRDDCDRPAPGGRLCPADRARLDADLMALPWLIRQLETTVTGQATTTGGFDWNASIDANAIGMTLRVWCRELAIAKVHAPERGMPMEGPTHRGDIAHPCEHTTCQRIRRDRSVKPLDRATYWATWLHAHLPVIDRQPWAGQFADEIEFARKSATWAIDARTAKLILGKCSTPQPDGTICDADLTARSSDSVIQCPACPALHEVAGRRTNLLDLTEDLLLTAAEIAHAVPEAHGITVTLKDVSNWAARGRISARGAKTVDGRERATYRVGDVLDVARATATRRTSNGQRTAA